MAGQSDVLKRCWGRFRLTCMLKKKRNESGQNEYGIFAHYQSHSLFMKQDVCINETKAYGYSFWSMTWFDEWIKGQASTCSLLFDSRNI